MFRMASCVVIRWPPNEQWVKCMLDAFNLCLHSHMRRLDVDCWIKPKRKCNVKVKVECAMQNELIDGWITNHSPSPLPKQEWMRALKAEQMESSSKIDLNYVSWWMSIDHKAPTIARLLKEGCISLVIGARPSCITCKHDWSKCGPPSTWKNTFPWQVCQKYKT